MAAVIFSGSAVKALKKELKLGAGASLISGTLDPSSSAVNAVRGSLYQNETTGNIYKKTDNGLSTNWTLFSTGSDTTYGMTSDNLSNGNKTVSTGTSLFVPYLTIDTGDTYTVSTGSQLVSVDVLTVDGTLTVNGTGIVKVL